MVLPSFFLSPGRRKYGDTNLLPIRHANTRTTTASNRGHVFKPHPICFRVYHRCRSRRRVVLLAAASCGIYVAVTTFLWIFRHSQCFSREAGVVWHEGPAHSMTRNCPAPDYPTLTSSTTTAEIPPERICITTLSDTTTDQSTTWLPRWLFSCRNFNDVQPLTWANQAAYAAKHGYTIVDASSLMDTTRPPAWSKIKAVQRLLGVPLPPPPEPTSLDNPPECDWVLWMDADVVFMNSDIRLESLLPTRENAIDLVVTYDRRFTANSGVWLIRNSDWSKEFLHMWWSMTGWVRPHGLSLSGDNAAFGHLVQRDQADGKIAFVERCNMNSFGVFLTTQQLEDLQGSKLEEQDWYLSTKFYHAGDFVAHASGIDQKAAGIELLLQRAT